MELFSIRIQRTFQLVSTIYIRFRYENYLLCKIYNTEPYEK